MNMILQNLLCFCYFTIYLPFGFSEQAIIKNDTMKGWYKQAYQVDFTTSELWSIPTVSDTFYEICGSGKDVDIWLISKHVSLSEIFPDLIYVDVETSEFKLCFDPRSSKYVPCYSNYFQVYVYRGQNEPNIPSGNDRPAVKKYLLNNFSPVYNITNTTSPKATNKTENYTFTFHQNKSKGITFGIRSRGACGRMYRMKMYYYYCEKTCKNRVMFPKTISPANGSKEVKPGNCSVNSMLPNNETNSNGSCSSNGTWSIPDTVNCSCIQGYSSGRGECGRCSAVTSTSQTPTPVTPLTPTPSLHTSGTTVTQSAYNTTTKAKGRSKILKQLHIIIIAVGSGLLLIILVLVIICLRRRGKGEKRPVAGIDNRGVELPNVGHRTYVDPLIYDRPEDVLTEFTSEVDPSILSLEMMIGGGEFGDVYKGKMTKPDGNVTLVAVKTLKHDATPKSEKDFLLEALVMGQFNHPNVVHLEGVVTKSVPRMIVIEFMNNGSLDSFLKVNDGILSVLQLIGMARDVAAGMKYLAEINFVHRDLAARNILLNESLLCKVSDFGLSRELETTDSSRGEYATTGGKIPIRWTAPEAIAYRKFSSASDVWSYGILLWEMMTFGERPYYDWDNFKVMDKLNEGYRLPSPKDCPQVVHELMLHCWQKNRRERPNFAAIHTQVDKWMRLPGILKGSADPSSTLGEWLESIKMQTYLPVFLAAGYQNPSQLSDLKDEDLRTMGITLIGHRNKVLKSVMLLPGARDCSQNALSRGVSLRV